MKPDANRSNLVKYRRSKAFETITDAEKLIELNMLSVAMNRIYYSGFYIVYALMLLDNKNFKKHKQLIGWFNKEYLKPNIIDRKIGKLLNDSYERRTALDYHDYTTVIKSEAKFYLKEMKKFILEVDKLIEQKLKNSSNS